MLIWAVRGTKAVVDRTETQTVAIRKLDEAKVYIYIWGVF